MPEGLKMADVPAGWKLVPAEMTPEMRWAGSGEIPLHGGSLDSAWRAMLEATPSPPTAPALASDARDALRRLKARESEDVEEWAARLAADSVALGDVETEIMATAPAAPVGDLAGLSEEKIARAMCRHQIALNRKVWDGREDMSDESLRRAEDAGWQQWSGFAKAVTALLPAAHRETVGEEEIVALLRDWFDATPNGLIGAARAILARLTAPRAEGETQDGWKPISTAPKDGQLIAVGGGCAFWDVPNERWASAVGECHGRPLTWAPTHWKSINPSTLPASPDAVQTNGGKR